MHRGDSVPEPKRPRGVEMQREREREGGVEGGST